MSGFKPNGWHTITPRIVTRDRLDLLDLLRHVFQAEFALHTDGPTEVRMGDSIIMVSEDGERSPMPVFLYVYVRDVDTTYHTAVMRGAASLESPRDLPYGDRRAMVSDAWGNVWQIATRLRGTDV